MGTVDDYLTGLGEPDAAVVGGIYEIARAAVPGTEQGTGYGMPALTYRGKPLLSVMRARGHIGIYPFSAAAVAAVEDRLAGVDHAKGTIRLPPDQPVDTDLITALVTARRQQIDG